MKTHKMFPSRLCWKNLKTQQLRVILNLCLSQARTEEYHVYRNVIVLENVSFSKRFLSTLKRKAVVFQIHPF